MISRTRSRIAASNPSRREPSWSTSLSVLVFTMAYSSCALNLLLRDSGLLLSMTSQENTPSTFLQESRQNRDDVSVTHTHYHTRCFGLKEATTIHTRGQSTRGLKLMSQV